MSDALGTPASAWSRGEPDDELGEPDDELAESHEPPGEAAGETLSQETDYSGTASTADASSGGGSGDPGMGVPSGKHAADDPFAAHAKDAGPEPVAGVVAEEFVVMQTDEAAEEESPPPGEDAGAPAEDASAPAAGTIRPPGGAAADASASAGTATSGLADEGDDARWSEIKSMFVDDPSASVKLASGMVERAMERLMTSLKQRQGSLTSSFPEDDAAGTEQLRTALRGYRSLFEQLDQMSSQFPAERDRRTGKTASG